MTQLTNVPWVVGSTVRTAGFFTKLHTLGDLRDEKELERRLGFEPGSLSLGWYVLFMLGRPPVPSEFRLGGYTHFSDGHIRGHRTPKGPHVEDSLRSESIDVLSRKQFSAANFTIDGPQRLTKIVPVLKPQRYWHPDPNPIPQWQLASQMDFIVSAFHKGSVRSP